MDLELYQYNKREMQKALDEATAANARIIMILNVGVNAGHKIGVTLNPQIDARDMITALEVVVQALKESQQKKSKTSLITPGQA